MNMKKIVSVLLLSTAALSAPAFADTGNSNVELNYGLDLGGTIGIQGDFDLSQMVNAPISIEGVYKNYSQSYSFPTFTGTYTYKYSYTGLGVAGIFNFNGPNNPLHLNLDSRIQPYAGIGLMHLSATLSSNVPGGYTFGAADTGGIYLTGGVRYKITPQFAVDGNWNNFGGLTIGAALYF